MRRLAVLVLIAACGGGSGDDDGDDAPQPDAMAGDWETLITSTWTTAGQDEHYMCERLTIDEDIWIKAFDAVIPEGHHHAVLTVQNPPSGPDGLTECDAGTNAPAMVYGNAPGVDAITFPDGVAVKIPAGSQLLLNLHLYNTQPGEVSRTSSVLFQRIDEADVEQEAEIVLMGPVNFQVPSGPSEVTGSCTMTGDTTLFMFTPHMHKKGVHALVTARRAAGDLVLHDKEYAFDDQQFYDLGNVAMEQGDQVEIVCSYLNPDAPTTFGDSTDQEMCFASTYRYPKLGATFGIVCTDL